ncbi:MAG: hypothetical protein DMG17_19535 [Acidobacteria bacterium]|nr:MAG: hypothetical protein DMG17_19535 [Acidobacteriota bacterium]
MRFADRRDNAFGTYKHFTDPLSFLVILVADSDTAWIFMRPTVSAKPPLKTFTAPGVPSRRQPKA